MYKEKKIYAVYRCLYGEDFVKESIESIIDHVDKVFVFHTNKFWGGITKVTYCREEIVFPTNLSDATIKKIKSIKSEKIILIDQGEFSSYLPWNLYTVLVNNIVIPKYGKPDIFVMPEVDHVFPKDNFEIALNYFIRRNVLVAKTRQIELWRTPYFRVPKENGRIGTVFWNMEDIDKLPETHGNANPVEKKDLKNLMINSTYHYNLGFMYSEKTMYWKHLSALAFAKNIGDSRPSEQWLEKKWLNWDYENNNTNLHMSVGFEHIIPKILKYENPQLPKSILEKYSE